MNNARKQFVAPTLVEYGKFEEITQGNGSGTSTDAVFPTMTPQSDLTFS